MEYYILSYSLQFKPYLPQNVCTRKDADVQYMRWAGTFFLWSYRHLRGTLFKWLKFHFWKLENSRLFSICRVFSAYRLDYVRLFAGLNKYRLFVFQYTKYEIENK